MLAFTWGRFSHVHFEALFSNKPCLMGFLQATCTSHTYICEVRIFCDNVHLLSTVAYTELHWKHLKTIFFCYALCPNSLILFYSFILLPLTFYQSHNDFFHRHFILVTRFLFLSNFNPYFLSFPYKPFFDFPSLPIAYLSVSLSSVFCHSTIWFLVFLGVISLVHMLQFFFWMVFHSNYDNQLTGSIMKVLSLINPTH